MLYRLAEIMGCRVREVMEMPVAEYAGWIAYLRMTGRIPKK